MSSLTKACRFRNDIARTRLPIQKSLLREILKSNKHHYLDAQQPYLAILYQTLFTTAYFGLFRVSEITTTPSMHVIRVSDVHVGTNKHKILFVLRSSKTHGKYSKPQTVKVSATPVGHERRPTDKWFCPYTLLTSFIEMRLKYAHKTEPFFIFKDRSPVTGDHIRSTLRLHLKLCGFDESLYGCHSLRGGRAQDLLKYGISVETIKK